VTSVSRELEAANAITLETYLANSNSVAIHSQPWLEFYGPCPITLLKKDLAIKLTILPQSQDFGSVCITGCLPNFPNANPVKASGRQLKRPNPRHEEKDPEKAGPETASTRHGSVVRSLYSTI
jgi:hypothetical protein